MFHVGPYTQYICASTYTLKLMNMCNIGGVFSSFFSPLTTKEGNCGEIGELYAPIGDTGEVNTRRGSSSFNIGGYGIALAALRKARVRR